jgi:lipopolysaccharide cholinephosphotransferase
MDTENIYGTLEMQKALLVLLDAFNAHCSSHGIDYSLCSGSLLGAIRHDGFIPWDDDIDVIMDRENYYKLKASFEGCEDLVFIPAKETENWLDRVRLAHNAYSGSGMPTLDVFILDVVPRSGLLTKFKQLTVLVLQGMIKPHLLLDKGGFFLKACTVVTWLMGRPFSMGRKIGWYHKVAQWGKNQPSDKMAMWIDQYKGIGKRYPADILSGFEPHKFENTEAMVMKGYDAYLRTAYGDNYMTPPQMKDRTPIHMTPGV